MDLFEIIKQKMELEDLDILNYSPLTLAYIGDCIYELVIRTIIVDEANRSVNKIHQAASSLVKAGTQSAMADYLMDSFSDEELAIYKRGRNSKVVTKAKNASMKEYKAATGFEAVMGYLYLTNRSDRMMELIKEGLNYVKSSSEEKK